MYERIIPRPKRHEEKDGLCELSSLRECVCSGLGEESVELLRQDFGGLSFVKGEVGSCRAVFGRRGGEAKACPALKPQGYRLTVEPGFVEIQAGGPAGLWHGFQTLIQLKEQDSGRIPAGVVEDEPAVERRGVHWDLKGYQPKFETLLEEFRRLAQYKVNLVLLELEDKYDYQCAPEVGVPGAYTAEQLRVLSRHAAALGITVVPKLQCLGHADYLLKHPRYRHLREAGHPYQYCPRSDEAFALWKAMAGELMELFAEHRGFFHVGADETDKLGVCPECAKHSKADSYVFHVERCLDFVVGQGRVPIMWDDILRDAHGVLGTEGAERARSLAAKAILNYWSYGYGGVNNNFGFLPVYLGRGARVWGASGFSGCDNWAGSLPPLELRAKNIDAWTKSAIESKLEAVVATGWTRIASGTPPTEPLETSWFTILYAAESMWSGRPYDYGEFVDALSWRLYGRLLPGPLRGAVMNIERNHFAPQALDPRLNSAPALAALQHAAAAESFAHSLNGLVACRRMFQGQLGEVMPDYLITVRRNMLKRFRDDLAAVEAGCRKWLAVFYEAGTVDEFVRSRFDYCHEYADDLARLLDQTKEQ